jgi:UDP-N-acetylglucosamine acyltransferase
MQKLNYINEGAKIADNVHVDYFTVIHEDVEIGEGTWIGSNVTIYPGARIGKNCKIFPGAVISATPQDLKFDGEYTTVEIGDNCTIRECVTINRGTTDKQRTVIGKNCLIMAYCHVAHDCVLGDNVILANSVQLAGHVELGEHAFIGGTSAVHQFVKIGEHVMVGGGSLVRKDVPPFITAAREPLSYIGLNTLGLRRRGFSNQRIQTIQEIYRHLFLSGKNFSEGIEIVKSKVEDSIDRENILNFFVHSKRGIIKKGNGENIE